MTCALWSEGCQACRALANLKRMTGHSSDIWGPRKGCSRGQGRAGARGREGWQREVIHSARVVRDAVTTLCACTCSRTEKPHKAALSLP